MARLLGGREVITSLHTSLAARVETLKEAGVFPMLALVRIGERGDDVAYETGACKRAETIGVSVRRCVLPETVSQRALRACIEQLNADPAVHGCLLMRPLPDGFDETALRNVLCPEKDVDGITDLSLAGVFTGVVRGFPPCTAQACMEILHYYDIPLAGRRAVVVGRSLVVGKPLSMLLLNENATVTVCHTRTVGLAQICREADVLVVAAGREGVVGRDCFAPGQTVVDVGIHLGADGRLHGDVDAALAEPAVDALTPVPGGVGLVTSTVLIKHTVEAAERALLGAENGLGTGERPQ